MVHVCVMEDAVEVDVPMQMAGILHEFESECVKTFLIFDQTSAASCGTRGSD